MSVLLPLALLLSPPGEAKGPALPAVENAGLEDFRRSFAGTINNTYAIQVDLTKTGPVLEGRYRYVGNQGSLKLRGEVTPDGSFTLSEFNAEGNMTGVFTGRFDGNAASGNWSKPDGSREMRFSFSHVPKGNVQARRQHCEVPPEEDFDNHYVTTCFYGVFQSRTLHEMDWRTHWFRSHQLLRKEGGAFTPIKNSEAFQTHRGELETRLNAAVVAEYKRLLGIPGTDFCRSQALRPPLALDGMGVEFAEAGVEFHIDFGMPNACLAFGGMTVTLTYDEADRYLAHP